MRNATLKITLVATIITVAVLAVAQDRHPKFPDQSARFANAANRWMLDPVDLKAQKDTTTPDIRRIRDTFWDEAAGQPTPLSKPANGYIVHFEGSGSVDMLPELPKSKNGTWIIGRFETYRTYLSQSERSIYTEINVRVHRVFGTPSFLGVAPGTLIDVGCDGGTILAPWNGTYTYQVNPTPFYLQPGHTYLMLLKYEAQGSFFLASKHWDLTDGFAKPDDSLEAMRAKQGKTTISGLSVADVIRVLEQKHKEGSLP